MIEFTERSSEAPLVKFFDLYTLAKNKKDLSSDVAIISSLSKTKNEVNSRCVNIKFVENDRFIFFSNYDSPKSNEFKEHNQIAALLYWPSINIQIRMKAKIKKTSNDFNKRYFFERSEKKNALSISSNQSQPISSYEQVKEKYNKTLNANDLKKCPDYWGGFSFKPYEIEFWKGNQFRLNRRDLYLKKDNNWSHTILEP